MLRWDRRSAECSVAADMSETLEAAGMVPSATLFIRMQG